MLLFLSVSVRTNRSAVYSKRRTAPEIRILNMQAHIGYHAGDSLSILLLTVFAPDLARRSCAGPGQRPKSVLQILRYDSQQQLPGILEEEMIPRE